MTWFVPREDTRGLPAGCVLVMETETALRQVTSLGRAVSADSKAMLVDSAVERRCSRPLGWFCYLMFSY